LFAVGPEIAVDDDTLLDVAGMAADLNDVN
jgi:hypothetical protein